MRIKAIVADCPNCKEEVCSSNFALSAISIGPKASPILYCQFNCPECEKTTQLDRIESIDFTAGTRHQNND